MPTRTHVAKCASRKICSSTGETVFVQCAQSFDTSRESAFAYGGFASSCRYVESDPVGLVAGPNTYTYVRGNPVSRIDSLGLRDVIVAVWTSQIVNGSVGHVFIGEMNGTTITSQFPSPHGIEGANTTKTWLDTIAAEGRSPDSVYKVTVPNDSAFDAVAAAARGAPRWSAFPDGETSTNCSTAAADALRAGGVKGISSASSTWPNWMNTDLTIGSWIGKQVTRLPAVPW